MRCHWGLLALATIGRPSALQAQAAPATPAEITAVVQRYIDAMQARDTAYVRAALLPGFTQVAVRHPGGEADVPRIRTVDEVVADIAARKGTWVGRVWAPSVSVHGGVAVFIAPYDSWYDGRLTNCGSDHYILARSGGRWLISQLIYTVQREHCPPSPLRPPS